MIIRPLTTLDDCRRVAALEQHGLGLHRRRRRRAAAGADRLDQARRDPARGLRRRADQMQGFVYSMPGLEGRRGRCSGRTCWACCPAARDAGAGPAAEAGAARGGAGHGPRPDRVDLRSAAGAERPLQLRQARRGRRGVRGERLRRVEQPAAPRRADRPVRRGVADRDAARRAPDCRRPAMPAMRDSRVLAAPVVNPSHASGAGGWRRALPI